MPEQRTISDPCTAPAGFCYPSDVGYWQNQLVSRWASITPQQFKAIVSASMLARYEQLKRESDALQGGFFAKLGGKEMVNKLIGNLQQLDRLLMDSYARAKAAYPGTPWQVPTGITPVMPPWWAFVLAGGVIGAAIWAANR